MARGLARLSDAELLALACDEPEAFGIFYARHWRAVLSYLSRRTGNGEVALDLTSEVFAAAFDASERYRSARAGARAWLFGIARNTLLASYRRRAVERSARRKLGVAVVGCGHDAWHEVESRLDASWAGLLEGLEELSPVEREAVRARVIDERDYADIALALDATEAAIRQRVSRGLAKLSRRAGRSAG